MATNNNIFPLSNTPRLGKMGVSQNNMIIIIIKKINNQIFLGCKPTVHLFVVHPGTWVLTLNELGRTRADDLFWIRTRPLG